MGEMEQQLREIEVAHQAAEEALGAQRDRAAAAEAALATAPGRPL